MGYGDILFRGISVAHPALQDVFRLVADPSLVSTGWLSLISDEGWAWWYMDDGSCERGGVRLHTEGYSYDEVVLIQKFLSNRFGIRPAIQQSKRKYHFLRLGVEDSIQWLRRLRRYIAPGMEFKFPDDFECGRRPASWGARL
jgi:hypothetical protein